jgi:hypothetical protein
VAPLWAGLLALINQGLGRKVGFINLNQVSFYRKADERERSRLVIFKFAVMGFDPRVLQLK